MKTPLGTLYRKIPARLKRAAAALALALVMCALGIAGAICLPGAGRALADERADYLLAVAVSELGYTATKGGYSKYGEWGGNPYAQWCSEFISWCVSRADEVYGTRLLGEAYPLQTSCDEGAAWFAERGRYVTVSGTVKNAGAQFYLSDGVSVADRPYVPQPGDLIYIEWYQYHRLDHTGIVEYVSQDADGTYYVHTIEGNNNFIGPTPSVVARYTYRLDDPSIRGYGVLQEGLVGVELTMGSSGESVIEYQKTLRDLGYYNGDCAGKYGKATAEATKAYQKAKGLVQSGDADRATWMSIGSELATARLLAQATALHTAQERANAMIDRAREAITSSWFGEFDPYDEQTAWARLTADITVLDVASNEKIYLCDAPNGKRKTYADFRGYFYGSSVYVKVLEQRDGWVLIEAYNMCDEIERGWVRASRIKTVTPNQQYGIIVDKMTQRLYLYKEGKLLTTLVVSTGTSSGSNNDYNETNSGEFLLCSWTGGFFAGNLWCNYAIRFNGGDLLHLVPSIFKADGTEDFTLCESALGTKASHGCIRVQREPNEDGYNHLWLWNNLPRNNVKIIVWDEDGRRLPETDNATPMYYNPKGGVKYHTVANCKSVKSTYLPLTGITYGELTRFPYTDLKPCGTCNAPERPETVAAWNGALDQAYAELGM